MKHESRYCTVFSSSSFCKPIDMHSIHHFPCLPCALPCCEPLLLLLLLVFYQDPWSQVKREYLRRTGSAGNLGGEPESPVAHLLGCVRRLVARDSMSGRAAENAPSRHTCSAAAAAVASGAAVSRRWAHLGFWRTMHGSLDVWRCTGG